MKFEQTARAPGIPRCPGLRHSPWRRAIRQPVGAGSPRPASQWGQDRRGRTAIGHLSLDALGHELQLIGDVLLEIAIRRTTRHRADRAHAAIGFERTALIKIYLARTLVRSSEKRTDHRTVGAGRDRLGEIAGIFDAAIRDD